MGLFDSLRRLFRGAPPPPTDTDVDEGIAAFWSWWASAQPELRDTVASGLTPALIRSMSERVDAIHPELGWEFGKGESSLHRLVLTGGGDGRLRLVAERWRAAGPGDDETWSFHATKPPMPPAGLADMRLDVGGHQVSFVDVQIGVVEDAGSRLLDVEVWHPVFPRLPEAVRGQITFLALDAAVGEDGVERWLGAIEPATSAPASPVDLAGLRARVEAMAAQVAAASWVLGQGADADTGQPCIYAIDQAVKRWDHPLLDTRVLVRLPYAPNEAGMPADPDVVPVLDALEDDVVESLASAAAHVGRRTGAGERRIWLYVDGRTDTADRVQAWGASCGRPCTVEVALDPLWEDRPR